jgi:hypothetical protein
LERSGAFLMRLILVFALAMGGTLDAAAAQTPQPADAGQIRITVRDATGLPVPDASVTVTSAAGVSMSAPTTDRGEALFERLAPGEYDARVAIEGFVALERPGIAVTRGRRSDVGVELQVAGIEEQIQVVPAAEEAFVSALTAEQIEALPDDPTELAQVLEQLVGAGLDIRVNGFSGGELPRGGRIAEVRIRWDAASASGRGDGPRVEIRTQPGSDGWRNRVDLGVRDERFNARNAYSGQRPTGQTRQYGWNVSGPLVPNRTGISVSLDRSESFEQQAVRAARPGGVFSALVPQPARRTEMTVEVEHALTAAQQLRGEIRLSGNDQNNLGVSEFDLPERAYAREDTQGRLRLGHRGTYRQRYVNDLRLQFGWQSRESMSASDATTIRVLDAFTMGGAQIQGGTRSRELEIEDELEFTLARVHQIEMGLTINGTSHRGDERRNAAGMFTFASLEAFEAGRPTTFTQRIGDPTIAYSMARVGWHVQDDYRVHRTVMLNLGVRHDFQTHLSDRANVSPHLGVNWTPLGARRTAIRVSAGRFYQFLDPSLYEQTLRVDGEQQRDLVISSPGFPDAFSQGVPLGQRPSSIIRFGPELDMPSTWRMSVGMDQPLAAWARLRATYARRMGRNLFRSRDVNAPIDGVRPDSSLGTVTQVESRGRSLNHSLVTRLTVTYRPRRLSGSVAYTLGEAMDDSDGTLTLPPDSNDLSGEWGPGRQDIRHRLQGSVNTSLWAGFRVDANLRTQSAPPYTITTGLDLNGDGEHNERPAGIGRNTARGVASTNLDVTLTWGRGYGARRGAEGAQGVQGGGERRGDNRRAAPTELVRFEIFARASNVLNAVNPQRFSGVLRSPFFGRPTSAAAARRVNLGMRVLF